MATVMPRQTDPAAVDYEGANSSGEFGELESEPPYVGCYELIAQST